MNDLTCRRFSDLLDGYLEGSLSEDLSGAVLEHAQKCPGCGAVLRVKKELSREVRVPPEVIARTEEGVGAMIAAARRQARPGARRRLLVPALASACVILLFTAGFLAGELRSLRQQTRSLRETIIRPPMPPGTGHEAVIGRAGRAAGAMTVAELALLLERLPDRTPVLSPEEAGRLARERSFLRPGPASPVRRMLEDGLTAGEALEILISLGLDPDERIEPGGFTEIAVPPALLRPRSAAGPAS